MSVKQAAIQAMHGLAESASWADVVTALQEAKATEDALRRYDERGGIPDDDLTDEEWMAAVCRSLADDLNDPRQDIYSLEDERESVHDPK